MRTRLCAASCLVALGATMLARPVLAQTVAPRASSRQQARVLPPSNVGPREASAPTATEILPDDPPAQAVGGGGSQVTLDQLQHLALERNADLLAVRQEIAAARGFLTQAGLRPNPGLDMSFGTGRPLGSSGEQDFEIGYAHTFELGGKRARRIDVGRVGVEIAELLVADRERRLRAEITVRYAEALAATRHLETLSELAEVTTRAARAAEHRVAEGEAAPVERALLRVEAGRLSAERLLAESAGARAIAELKLAAGFDPNEPLTLGGDLRPAVISMSLDEAIVTAFAERPDLKAARAEEARAAADVRLARAERVPDVIGLVRYGRTQSRFAQLGLTPGGQPVPLLDTDHILTFGVSIPLPFANRNQGLVEASNARQRAATLRRQFVEQSVLTEVRAAYAQLTAVRRAIEAFDQDVVSQSQESIIVIRASYDLGEVALLDLLQEQRRLVETQQAYTEILKEHSVARAALSAAIAAEVK